MNIYNFIFTLILFIILDLIWISFNYNYYITLCNKIQKEPFVLKIPPIIISYLALSIGLYLYIKLLSLDEINYYNSIYYGFLLGFAIYGTYSYTSCTYYKNYKYYDAFKDTIWGIILFIICGLFYAYLSKTNFLYLFKL